MQKKPQYLYYIQNDILLLHFYILYTFAVPDVPTSKRHLFLKQINSESLC